VSGTLSSQHFHNSVDDWFESVLDSHDASPDERENLWKEFNARERGTTTVAYWRERIAERIRFLRMGF
jgi:hypothetical protein